MTACFKIMRALQQQSNQNPDPRCISCVYFSDNLDQAEFPAPTKNDTGCGLSFLPGDNGCGEMRTDNCSARKARD